MDSLLTKQALTPYFTHSTPVLMYSQLDLSSNRLCGVWWEYGVQQGTYTATGINALAGALRVNASLTECNVRGNRLDGESATMLAKVGAEKRIMLFGIKHDQKEANFRSEGLDSVDVILIASDLAVTAQLTKIE